MLLVFDIGNTNIKAALCADGEIVHQWRISTDVRRTGDEYFSVLRSLFHGHQIDCGQIEDAAISSVVPALIGPFVLVTQHLLGKKPLLIGPDIYHALPIKLRRTAASEIGTDLLCDALESWCRYQVPCVIADFGTALSFIAVSGGGEIVGVAIAPGIGTALKALFTNTAQLPSVPLEVPPSVLGTNTTESIQSGILFGYTGLVDGMVSAMKQELVRTTGIQEDAIRTIATGGLNSILEPITSVFDVTDKELTVQGIVRAAQFAGFPAE